MNFNGFRVGGREGVGKSFGNSLGFYIVYNSELIIEANQMH